MANYVSQNGLGNNHGILHTPGEFLSKTQGLTCKYSIMVLNRPILCDADLLFYLWNEANIRQTVDGGTNHWLSFLENNSGRAAKAPDIVSGDFDSIREDVMLCVEKLGCRIVKTPDQNETDFTKAVKLVDNNEIDTILVIAESSGRMDQIMASIQTLFKMHLSKPDLKIVLMSSKSLSWLLPEGKHMIQIPQSILDAKTWCSLIPVGAAVNVTTQGLQWDLNNTRCAFGDGIVSTSNTYSGKLTKIEIITDGYIFWSMGTCKED